jgi:hypothetical protein
MPPPLEHLSTALEDHYHKVDIVQHRMGSHHSCAVCADYLLEAYVVADNEQVVFQATIPRVAETKSNNSYHSRWGEVRRTVAAALVDIQLGDQPPSLAADNIVHSSAYQSAGVLDEVPHFVADRLDRWDMATGDPSQARHNQNQHFHPSQIDLVIVLVWMIQELQSNSPSSMMGTYFRNLVLSAMPHLVPIESVEATPSSNCVDGVGIAVVPDMDLDGTTSSHQSHVP